MLFGKAKPCSPLPLLRNRTNVQLTSGQWPHAAQMSVSSSVNRRKLSVCNWRTRYPHPHPNLSTHPLSIIPHYPSNSNVVRKCMIWKQTRHPSSSLTHTCVTVFMLECRLQTLAYRTASVAFSTLQVSCPTHFTHTLYPSPTLLLTHQHHCIFSRRHVTWIINSL